MEGCAFDKIVSVYFVGVYFWEILSAVAFLVLIEKFLNNKEKTLNKTLNILL